MTPIDPAIAARLAELEALVAAQRAALEAERARRTDAEAERDRLRAAYEALTREVELARRRLMAAKEPLELSADHRESFMDLATKLLEEQIGITEQVPLPLDEKK